MYRKLVVDAQSETGLELEIELIANRQDAIGECVELLAAHERALVVHARGRLRPARQQEPVGQKCVPIFFKNQNQNFLMFAKKRRSLLVKFTEQQDR